MMNPKTGEIMAMSDYPNFDLNDPENLTPFLSESEIASLDEENKSDEEQDYEISQKNDHFQVHSCFTLSFIRAGSRESLCRRPNDWFIIPHLRLK